jgi:hypothetical protein
LFLVSPAADKKTADLIEKENLKKRMSNVEVMYSSCRELLCRTVYLKKAEQSDSTLRHSAVRYSIFFGSLFQLCGSAGKRWPFPGRDPFYCKPLMISLYVPAADCQSFMVSEGFR